MKERTFVILAVLPLLGAIWVPTWQVLNWLGFDHWEPVSAWSAALYVGIPYPISTWLGFNHLLQILPLTLCVVVTDIIWIGLLVLGLKIGGRASAGITDGVPRQ